MYAHFLYLICKYKTNEHNIIIGILDLKRCGELSKLINTLLQFKFNFFFLINADL